MQPYEFDLLRQTSQHEYQGRSLMPWAFRTPDHAMLSHADCAL